LGLFWFAQAGMFEPHGRRKNWSGGKGRQGNRGGGEKTAPTSAQLKSTELASQNQRGKKGDLGRGVYGLNNERIIPTVQTKTTKTQ